MSTKDRKARKRAGIKFERTPKVGTPLIERAGLIGLVPGVKGTRYAGRIVLRSSKKLLKGLEARGVSETDLRAIHEKFEKAREGVDA